MNSSFIVYKLCDFGQVARLSELLVLHLGIRSNELNCIKTADQRPRRMGGATSIGPPWGEPLASKQRIGRPVPGSDPVRCLHLVRTPSVRNLLLMHFITGSIIRY